MVISQKNKMPNKTEVQIKFTIEKGTSHKKSIRLVPDAFCEESEENNSCYLPTPAPQAVLFLCRSIKSKPED